MDSQDVRATAMAMVFENQNAVAFTRDPNDFLLRAAQLCQNMPYTVPDKIAPSICNVALCPTVSVTCPSEVENALNQLISTDVIECNEYQCRFKFPDQETRLYYGKIHVGSPPIRERNRQRKRIHTPSKTTVCTNLTRQYDALNKQYDQIYTKYVTPALAPIIKRDAKVRRAAWKTHPKAHSPEYWATRDRLLAKHGGDDIQQKQNAVVEQMVDRHCLL